MHKALDAWPLHTADTHLTGKSLRHCQTRLAHAKPGDPYWDERVFNANIEHVTAEVDMVTGWCVATSLMVRQHGHSRPFRQRIYLTLR